MSKLKLPAPHVWSHVVLRPWTKPKNPLRGLWFWQFLAIVGIGTAVVGYGTGFSEIGARKHIPYFIEKTPQGDFVYRGIMTPASIPMTDDRVKNFLKHFITALHSVPADQGLLANNHYNSSYLTMEAAAGQLSAYYNGGYKFAELFNKANTVDLQFDYYSQVAPGRWIVHWTDIVSHNGNLDSRIPMAGEFAVIAKDPPSGGSDAAAPEAYIKNNPWGLYVTSFSITEANN